MSDPVNVSPSDLRRTADRLDELADTLTADLPAALSATSVAVAANPGWATTAALDRTGVDWCDSLGGAGRELRANGDRLRAVADGYEAADHRAAERLGEAIPSAPRRRGPW